MIMGHQIQLIEDQSAMADGQERGLNVRRPAHSTNSSPYLTGDLPTLRLI